MIERAVHDAQLRREGGISGDDQPPDLRADGTAHPLYVKVVFIEGRIRRPDAAVVIPLEPGVFARPVNIFFGERGGEIFARRVNPLFLQNAQPKHL